MAYRILRNPDTRRDERDAAISALGTKASYASLVVQLTVLLVMLGFSPPDTLQRFTHWLLANTLLATIMLSTLVGWAVMLGCYWRESRQLRTHP